MVFKVEVAKVLVFKVRVAKVHLDVFLMFKVSSPVFPHPQPSSTTSNPFLLTITSFTHLPTTHTYFKPYHPFFNHFRVFFTIFTILTFFTFVLESYHAFSHVYNHCQPPPTSTTCSRVTTRIFQHPYPPSPSSQLFFAFSSFTSRFDVFSFTVNGFQGSIDA